MLVHGPGLDDLPLVGKTDGQNQLVLVEKPIVMAATSSKPRTGKRESYPRGEAHVDNPLEQTFPIRFRHAESAR